MGRKLAREELFKLLLEAELKDENPVDILDEFFSRDEVCLRKQEEDFVRSCVLGIDGKKDEIKRVLDENMENWTFDRVGNVEKVLLRFATYELLEGKVGHEIVVNEAVELAKTYGDEKSHEFINGVLAKIIKKLG
jgi:N utilization substance protein B